MRKTHFHHLARSTIFSHLGREHKGILIKTQPSPQTAAKGGTTYCRTSNKGSPLMSAMCIKFMTYPWMWLFMKNPREGAQCSIRLATDPQLKQVTGEYFNDCEIATPSALAKDKALAKRLYMETMRVLKLTGGDDEKD